jgi:predicted dehydrogenase
VVDHQTVIVEFANGVTATHNLFCATARPTRTIHILGTGGEIEGDMERGIIKVRTPRPTRDSDHVEEQIDVKALADADDGHGGGDSRLVADFVSILQGNAPSKGVTRIEDSLTGHLIAFAADTAMREHRVVEIQA